MAKVYIESIPSSSYSRLLWDTTGSTNYVINDRVSLSDSIFSHYGGTVDDSKNRIYVCVNNNNSTTYPFDDSSNWVLAGSSEEYPCYAVDGSLNLNTMDNEVYLEFEADRYKGKGSNRYTWRQATAEDTEHGELIFSDGEYYDNGAGLTIDSLSFTAKNSGKVSIYWGGFNYYIFQGNVSSTAKAVAEMTGIKFIIGGTRDLLDNSGVIAFNSCVITDLGSLIGDYVTGSGGAGYRLGTTNQFIDLKNTTFYLPNASLALMGWQTQLYNGVAPTWESCTFYTGAGSQTSQYLPLFYSNNGNPIVKKCIFAFPTTGYNNPGWTLGLPAGSSENFIYCYDQSAPQPVGETAATLQDPLFVDPENGDLRLRPSSPCIPTQLSGKDKLESEYPQGAWFDSNASAGGDGSFANPYNNYGEAINSFTGDEAVVLIKEGQHELKAGYWSGSSWGTSNDLPKVYSDGIKFIGMGSSSVFTTTEVTNFGAFYSGATSNPNLTDTPFLFKDLDILLNNAGYINRGMITVRRAEYINVNVNQALNLGAINSQLFDNTTSSGTGYSSGEYLKMSGCTINVSISTNSGNTSYLLGNNNGQKQFSDCTFVDLNRTTSTIAAAPPKFLHHLFGSYPGSYLKNCMIYSKTSNTTEFGTNSSVDFDIENVVVYSTQASVSISNVWSDRITVLDPKLVATEPHNFDLRLRPNSPLIGGVARKSYKSNAVWIQTGSGTGTGTESDPFYFDQFSDAVLEAVNNTSFQLVLKDGTYIFSTAGAELADSNLSLVTLIAENKHDAIITDNGAAISISGLPSNQTLNIKNIKLISDAQFVSNTAIDLNANSCLFAIADSMNFPNVNISLSSLEVKLGFNTSQINSSNGTITNCTFIDKNPGASTTQKVNSTGSIDFKNCIFWSQISRSVDPANGTFKACASYNYTVTVDGTDIIYDGDPGFIDSNNSNYNLRPNSPLIGKGE